MKTAILAITGMLCLALAAPADEASETKTLVRDNNQFAVALYSQLAKDSGNRFFSPYSISSALAMTYGGARGKTADAMARTLRLELPAAQVPAAFSVLNRQLRGNLAQRGFELSIANALWGQKGFAFAPRFLELIRKNYDAGFQVVDFRGAPENARQTINRWVENETRDKIKDLIPAGVITPDSRLVLTNAIYLKSAWEQKFAKAATKSQPFTTSGGSKVDVPLMHGTRHTAYLANDQFQILVLPYAAEQLSLVVLLPRQSDRLSAVEQQLTADRLQQWLTAATRHDVDVFLPRFKLTAEFQLKDVLTAMGMGIAFGAGADFSGISTEDKLQISQVVHKAFVDLDEEGTEAAGATAVVLKSEAQSAPELRRVTFRADHPFLFLIRENRSGSVLFMGRLVRP